MYRLHVSIIVRIILVLSTCFILLQIFLLVCNCRCLDDNKKNMKLKEYDFAFMASYKEKIKQLNEKVILLQKELEKYRRIEKLLLTPETYNSKKSLNDVTFLKSYSPRTEFEVIPFNQFTSQHIYGEIGSLSRKPAASPIGQQALDITEALQYGTNRLNNDAESQLEHVSIDDFAEGILRNDMIHGTVYDLYFRSSHSPDIFKRLKLLRPFTELQSIGKPETIDTTNEWINLILPLSGRINKFREFIERFVETCIRRDRRIFLTIVYFGKEGREDIKSIMLNVSLQEKFEEYKVIFNNEEFSRGKGIQDGVESWTRGNVLMFFCDVDIYFSYDFLERCRLYTSPGRKIYYPIVFSQYNPAIVFGGQKPPKLKEQMYISYDAGFWRDFGFGMTCQYRDDFLNVGGFDLSIRGWGGEDIALYKQHLRSKLIIIRSYDRSIFHIYHPKNCQKTLSDVQFISCLQSKAISEGSHKQLGMLAFGSNLINGKEPDWGRRLQTSISDLSNVSQV